LPAQCADAKGDEHQSAATGADAHEHRMTSLSRYF
jgi:hypothetical protein